METSDERDYYEGIPMPHDLDPIDADRLALMALIDHLGERIANVRETTINGTALRSE